MNKIVNINLGGYPFIIDDTAYDSLKSYLGSIDRHFNAYQGHDDILFDIEHRIAELFREDLKDNQIVTQKHLDKVIAIMGSPSSFSSDSDEMGADESAYTKSEHRDGKKKLFRNPENKIIAGVCSGLAEYFGVSDPLWIRLLFVLLFFGFGTGPFVYLILWLVLPVAVTSADHLSMKGEPINVKSIADTVERELKGLKNTLTDLGKEFRNLKLL